MHSIEEAGFYAPKNELPQALHRNYWLSYRNVFSITPATNAIRIPTGD